MLKRAIHAEPKSQGVQPELPNQNLAPTSHNLSKSVFAPQPLRFFFFPFQTFLVYPQEMGIPL